MESDSDSSDCWMVDSSDDDSDSPPGSPTGLPVLKKGRTSMTSRVPEVVPLIQQFVDQNSAEAHNRRHDATAFANGVTLREMKTHVEKSLPGVSISRSTIHRMMQPARRNSINAKRHTGVINARVPAKRNSKTNDHKDFRYSCAFVNYMNELVYMCQDDALAMSCDDKNKINVGTLAVSRHFQIKRFFSEIDTPNYPDHDFPYKNSKLIPSGYMVLKTKNRSRSVSPQPKTRSVYPIRHRSASPQRLNTKQSTDKLGRKRVIWPRSGPLTVYLQSSKFHASNSASHLSHLSEVLASESKPVVSIIADGGPDWSTKSTVNLMNYGRLWRNLSLDGLIVTTYAPGHSRFNPIERAWGPLSKWLTGVTLPITLPGEEKPPCEQRGLSKEEVKKKEANVFDRASSTCAKYWQGRRYDGHQIVTKCVPCAEASGTSTSHTNLKEFVEASARSIRSSNLFKQLRQELRFLMEHCVRRTYSIEFYKCKSNSCDHCVTKPVRATKFFSLLDRLGGKLPSPVLDLSRTKGEYMTIGRLLEVPHYVHCGLDVNLPSKMTTSCTRGCQYVFLSKRDESRHNILCHSN